MSHHVRATPRPPSPRQVAAFTEMLKALRPGMTDAGPFPPTTGVPPSGKPRRREVSAPPVSPTPTSRQRQALRAAITRGGWQGKITPYHLDALWRRLGDLGLEHDPGSNTIRPMQAAPLQGGRPRTVRAADAGVRSLVVQQHMKAGHTVLYNTATGDPGEGEIVGWGRHGATVRGADGNVLAVPYTVMRRVTPPPQPGATGPARKSRRRDFAEALAKAETAPPEVLR